MDKKNKSLIILETYDKKISFKSKHDDDKEFLNVNNLDENIKRFREIYNNYQRDKMSILSSKKDYVDPNENEMNLKIEHTSNKIEDSIDEFQK